MKARPDAIAHSAAKIVSRLKAGGEKTTQALKSLCWRQKGIQVEVSARAQKYVSEMFSRILAVGLSELNVFSIFISFHADNIIGIYFLRKFYCFGMFINNL